MQIQFLYYEDCPSHDVALDRLRTVLADMGVQDDIDVIQVETEQQAHDLGFIGSPTIRIDGQDIDPVPPDLPYGLTCRAYQKPDGRISPLSPEMLIRDAVQMAASQT